MGKLTISMAIFNSYAKLAEGILYVGKHVFVRSIQHVYIISHEKYIAWRGHLIPYEDELKFISRVVQRGWHISSLLKINVVDERSG